MEFGIKTIFRAVVLFLFPRFPFLNALTLLLLLAERATRESEPPFDPKLIYLHLGLFFACALGMGFDAIRRYSALFHAIHLLCFAFMIYMSEALGYRLWVKIRMAHRIVGIAGYFILYAYFSGPKPRSKSLKRIGEITVGIYVSIATYVVLQSPEDKEAFLRFVPGAQSSLFIYATFLAAVGLCYIPGQFVYDVTVLLILLLTISTCLIDSQLSYWTDRRGLDYWVQVRLLADNMTILSGAILYLSCSKKKVIEDIEEKME